MLPLYWIAWEYVDLNSRMHSHGFFCDEWRSGGHPTSVTSGVVAWPSLHRSNYRSSQSNGPGPISRPVPTGQPRRRPTNSIWADNIPMGVALGRSVRVTLIDDNQQPRPVWLCHCQLHRDRHQCRHQLVRSNGMYGRFYVAFPPPRDGNQRHRLRWHQRPLVFQSSQCKQTCSMSGSRTTAPNLHQPHGKNRQSPPCPASPGPRWRNVWQSNAVLRLINNHYKGYLSFSATNYIGSESAGFITFVVIAPRAT